MKHREGGLELRLDVARCQVFRGQRTALNGQMYSGYTAIQRYNALLLRRFAYQIPSKPKFHHQS